MQDLHGYDNPWPAGGGKNLFTRNDLDTTQNNVRVKFANEVFTVTGSGSSSITIPYSFTATEQVVMRTDKTFSLANDGIRIYVQRKINSDSTIDYPTVSTNAHGVNSGGGFYSIYLQTEASFTGPFTFRIQVEKGSTATAWSPYSNLCPISGFTGLNVYGTGKNLFDKSTVEANRYIASNGKISGSNGWSVSDYIPVVPSGAYVLSGTGNTGSAAYLAFYDATKTYISGVVATTTSITPPSNARFIRLSVINVDTAQFEVGSTASDYAAFAGLTTLPVSWQSDAGTVYAGYLTIDKDGGCTLTGTHKYFATTWGSGSGGTSLGNYTRKTFTSPAKSAYPNYTNTPICNLASYKANYSEDALHFYVNASANNNCIVFLPNDASDDTVIEIVYELATPVTYTLASVTVPSLLQGENNLWADCGDLTITYLADGNASEIEALNILLGNRYVNNHGEDEPTDREALDILLGGNTR